MAMFIHCTLLNLTLHFIVFLLVLCPFYCIFVTTQTLTLKKCNFIPNSEEVNLHQSVEVITY